MIICVCKNVSDKDIRRCLNNDCNCSTVEDLQIELGVCMQCEKCEAAIKEIILESKK